MTNQLAMVMIFAGGGGASLGIKWATGREPDYAVSETRKPEVARG